MAKRVELNNDMLENVVGGNITFDWDGHIGHCGLNGDKSYTFNDRSEFIGFAKKCHSQGLSDAECLQAMIDNGIIY